MTCPHGRKGRCGITMYCVDLERHVRADYATHQCDTWWFCPGGTARFDCTA